MKKHLVLSAVLSVVGLLASGCTAPVRTDTLYPNCKFGVTLLPVIQMKWNDTLEFSVPKSAKTVRLQASADDVNIVDFGEVNFVISDPSGAQVFSKTTEGIYKDWIVDVVMPLKPGRYKLRMVVSNELERLFRVAVDSC